MEILNTDKMKFTVDKHEKYVLIKLNESKLNSLISPQLKSELILTNTEGQRNMILDLSSVKYSDSSGLGSLLVGHRICKKSEGVFILTGINENVSRLISISQLDNVLTIVGSVEEGIDLIFMEEIEKELKKEAR
jgi:anti-sigma B factor antagonist